MRKTVRTYTANIPRALSHPTRIALLELLRDWKFSARTIQEKLGLEYANLSNHLAILRSYQIFVICKDGSHFSYFMRNPMLVQGLDIMRHYIQRLLADDAQMLLEAEFEVSLR
jgi:ArsR family transcriptional regulator